jgi:hypothetical protein
MITKRFYYKVYSLTGTLLAVWMSDVVSTPTFRTVINGGSGELKIKLARPYTDFGEDNDVLLGNKVELWVADGDNIANNATLGTMWDTAIWDTDVWDNPITSFIKIYTGYISAYAPLIDGDTSFIDITVLGYVTEASLRVIRDGAGSTQLSYTSKDPAYILMDIVDKYRADGGVNLNYTGASINYTGYLVSYQFNNYTFKECLDKIVQLCPDNFYWYIDANNTVFLKKTSDSADHTLKIGKDISYLQTNKRLENLKNVVYVVGGGTPQLYQRYERTNSTTLYGKFEYKLNDGRVTDIATADIMAKRQLDYYEYPEIRTVVRIIDNNIPTEGEGQDIESYAVGDTITIKNLKYGKGEEYLWDVASWDVDNWDTDTSYLSGGVFTIVSLVYYPDYIEVEASSRLPEITKRVEDIKRQQDLLLQQNIPTTPTARTV